LTECIEWDDEEFIRVTGNKINNTIV
jgi:hypothetical protein